MPHAATPRRFRQKSSQSQKYPSKQEYIELVNQYQDTEDQKVKDKLATLLIKDLERLICVTIQSFLHKFRNPNDVFDDLKQDCKISVLRALKAWNREKARSSNTGFITYVTYWIRQAIYQKIHTEAVGLVWVPADGPPRGKEETAEFQRPVAYYPWHQSPKNLHSSTEAYDNYGEIMCLLQGIFAANHAQDYLEHSALQQSLDELTERFLEPRERGILQQYLQGASLQQIGQALVPPITREGVRLIKLKAMQKLRLAIEEYYPEFIPENAQQAA